MISDSVEIARPPAEVFPYLSDPERHPEWQGGLVAARSLTEGPTRAGSRATQTRLIAGAPREFGFEFTACEPPRLLSFRGVDGPIRPVATFTVEALDGGARSRVAVELELEGHGLAGRLALPLARREAARQIPEDHRRLKAMLEGGA